ncbi:hypothetical protein WT05_17110 [Burkholderia stagnalis]|nr:hypothetical protein WT05_17110 [Burkholderia stagnalis]
MRKAGVVAAFSEIRAQEWKKAGTKPTFSKQMVRRRGLGRTGATPAALARVAFRVLTQSAEALCFLG